MASYRLVVGEDDNKKQCLYLNKDSEFKHPIPYSVIKGLELKNSKFTDGRLTFTVEIVGKPEERLKKALAKKPKKRAASVVAENDLKADENGVVDLTTKDVETSTDSLIIDVGNRGGVGQKKPGDRPARAEPFRPKSAPNEFLKMKGIQSEKLKGADKIDDSFYTPRDLDLLNKKIVKYKVQCYVCNGTFVVPASEVPPVIGTERSLYRCESCCRAR